MHFRGLSEVEKCLFACMMANVKVGLLLKGEVEVSIVSSNKGVSDPTSAQLAEIKRQAKVICIDMSMGADVLRWFRTKFGVNHREFLAGNYLIERIEEESEVAIAA